jgi:hypothetical protein
MKVRIVGVVTVVAALSLVRGPAHAEQQVCLPGDNHQSVWIFDKEYRIPGHSLPCADVG